MARRDLTDKTVAALKTGKSSTVSDPRTRGLCVRIRGNSKTWQVVCRDPGGKIIWRSIGDTNLIGIAEARARAAEVVIEIKTGRKPAVLKAPESLGEIAEQFYTREIVKKGRRSAAEVRRTLDNHILPAWADRQLTSITRSDVASLIDRVEDSAGPCAADRTLSRIKQVFTWFENRDNSYVSPVTKMKRRIQPKERARERVLSEDEIRALWQATEGGDTFHALVRMLLITGQRLEKVSTMKWSDIEDGVWKIATEAREKGNAGELVLPGLAREVLKTQPVFASSPFVFAGRRRHYNGFSKGKARLDAELRFKQQWGLHDLRRTARSLMSAAGVRNDIAERVLGHARRGVEGTYDRHSYREEKAEALESLAGEMRRILSPDNVVKLAKRS